MPWAGTSHGPQAVLSNLSEMFARWENVTYLQFLEDSYATAASFRKKGSWIVQTEPGAEPLQVGD
jgi:hypothetical protein